jgi:2'-5' RNA ligase
MAYDLLHIQATLLGAELIDPDQLTWAWARPLQVEYGMGNMTYVSQQTSQRIFIGIPVGSVAQQAIERLLETMQACTRNLRWVPAQNRHLTLAFLGDISMQELQSVQHGFATAYRQQAKFQYQLSALHRFPNSSGRVIALAGEASEPLHGLVSATRELLQECGLGFERKKFRPHITLARVRNPNHPLMKIDQRVSIGMDVKRVVLYRSTLTESGSVYSVLGNADLR